MVEGLLEASETNLSKSKNMIFLKIWRSGARFPYLGFWSRKHENRHDTSLQIDWKVFDGSLEAYRWYHFKTIINFKNFKKCGGLGLNCHIWGFGPKKHENRHNSSLQIDWKIVECSLESRYKYVSNEPSVTFQSSWKLELCPFSCFFGGVKSPNMEIQPQTSKFLEILEIYNSFRIVSPICFQRALKDFSIFSQTRFMPIFVFLGPKPFNRYPIMIYSQNMVFIKKIKSKNLAF